MFTKIASRISYVVSAGLLIAMLSALDCQMACAAQSSLHPDATVLVDINSKIVSNFTGYGMQWDPYEYQPSEADWQLTLRRLDYMKPSIFRVMSNSTDYCLGFDNTGKPIYVWNNGQEAKLDYVFRLLDYAQAHNIEIILGEWAWPGKLDTPGAKAISGPEDPRWAKIIADYIDYLIHTRNYTIIKYYNYMNEPNGSWMWPAGQTPSFDKWATGLRNLHDEFRARKLDSVQIIGPDNAWDWDWLDRVAKQFPEIIGMYDMHWYATDAEVTSGAIEKTLAAKRSMLLSTDRSSARKPRILGESGLVDGKSASDQQLRVKDFEYGVLMADLAAQVARAGWTGAIAWDMDDTLHSNGAGSLKVWGLWNSHQDSMDPRDMTPRPWFYTWSLVERLFPKGADIVRTTGDSDLSNFRSMAAIWTGKSGKSNVSVMLVNDSNLPRTIKLQVPVPGNRTFVQYNYFSSDRMQNSNYFPIAKKTLKGVAMQSGVTVSLPSRGVLFLTTLPAGEQLAGAHSGRY